MQIEHVDFVSFLTQDIKRARRFYADTLGLELETEGEHDMEFRCGQVTLDSHQAFFRDPDGNSLILHRRYAPVEAR